MRNLLALAIVVLGLSSCDTRRRSLFQPAPSVVGTYTMRSVNDKVLPFPLSTIGTATKSLSSDTLALRTDGTLRRVSVYTTNDVNTSVPPIISSLLAAGTYTLSGTTIAVAGGVGPFTGSYSGGTLTLSEPGFIYVYQR